MYRAIIEFILGVKPDFNGLKLQPCMPVKWQRVKIKRVFRGATYNIEFIPSDKYSLIVNGKEIDGDVIPLCEKSSENFVVCYYVNQ